VIELALTVIYNDDTFFEECIESAKNNIKRIWFIVPFQTWDGRVDNDNREKNIKTINKYLELYPKWKLFNVDAKQQSEALNYGLNLAKKQNIPYAMILDSDEIWDTKDLTILESFITKYPDFNILTCKMHTYFKSIKYRIDPPQNLNPVIMVNSNINFIHARRPNSKKYKLLDIIAFHHPSHVRSDELMKIKLNTCSERDKIKNWYDEVWINWTPDMQDFHPTVAKSFHSVIKVTKKDLPEVLHKYLD